MTKALYPQNVALLAQDPNDEPVEFVGVVEQQQGVLSAHLGPCLVVCEHVALGAGPVEQNVHLCQ